MTPVNDLSSTFIRLRQAEHYIADAVAVLQTKAQPTDCVMNDFIQTLVTFLEDKP